MSSRGRSAIDPAGGQPYSAAALSLVFHPAHPMVPTLRADVRAFEVAGSRWLGGGCDLTPCYLFDEDIGQFHRHWRKVCDAHEKNVYPEFKAWCDRYFYLTARKEHRGTGGIFFDDLESPAGAGAGAGRTREFDAEAFTRDVAVNILPSWEGLAARGRQRAFTPAQREWQLLRMGRWVVNPHFFLSHFLHVRLPSTMPFVYICPTMRPTSHDRPHPLSILAPRYVEFNLLDDRGVRFGLSGGRMESIMVSAPPLVRWAYNVVPEPGSEEARLVEVLQKPREWA
jgi:coproporphyrinogen III oxidase